MHSSRYQGFSLFSDVLLIDNVYILFAYPSHAHESLNLPPLPEAHTKMDPRPFLPRVTPSAKAFLARGPDK